MALSSRKIHEDGMRALVKKLNALPAFRDTDICFSSDIYHFVDRLEDRRIDLVDIMNITFKAVKEHLCEMLFYAHLEDRPIRFNVKTDDIVLGLGCKDSIRTNKKIFKFHTVIENFSGRSDSRVSTYVINLEK